MVILDTTKNTYKRGCIRQVGLDKRCHPTYRTPGCPFAWVGFCATWVGSPTVQLPQQRSVLTTPFPIWAGTFIPTPMPKPVCRKSLNNRWVQYEVCITFLGRGMGMNITAHHLPPPDVLTRPGWNRPPATEAWGWGGLPWWWPSCAA